MITISFVIVSKDNEFKMTESDFNSFSHPEVKLMPILISNNRKPISVIYNKYLKELNSDYIFFMHSDVRFDLSSLINKLLNINNKYDVIGLCGCDKISYSVSPFNWFNGSKSFPNNRWGFVYHGEVGSSSYFSNHSPTVEHHPASCIDGLCIIFNKKAIDSGLKFDERFEFDHYDSDISFEAILNFKLNLGVIIEKTLYHYSVGKGILQEKFKISEHKFREKWNPKLLN